MGKVLLLSNTALPLNLNKGLLQALSEGDHTLVLSDGTDVDWSETFVLVIGYRVALDTHLFQAAQNAEDAGFRVELW